MNLKCIRLLDCALLRLEAPTRASVLEIILDIVSCYYYIDIKGEIEMFVNLC